MKFDDFHVFFWCRSRNYLQLVKNRNNREMIFKKKKNGGKYGITNNNSMLIIEMMKVPKKKIPLFNKRKTLARFARWFLIQFQKIDF